jgi:hypothetical protein
MEFLQFICHEGIRLFAVLAFALAIGDVMTTLRALAQPGIVEANPVMKFLMDKLGSLWILARLLMTLAVVLFVILLADDTWSGFLLLLANAALLGWVVWHNAKLARIIP